MFAWHAGLRTRIPAYVSAYSYVRMQVWHSSASVYPWAYAASGRGSNLVYMHHTARADTGEGFTGQTRDKKSGGGGVGGWRGLYPSGPLSTPVRYTYSMGKVTSLWGGDPSPPPPPHHHHPPLRRVRHVVTQWYVLLFLIMCAYGLAVYNVK